MFWRKGFILFLVLSILIFVLNFIARKKMDYSYADTLSYYQLYVVKEQLRISEVTENKDHSVTFAFSGKGVRKENVFKVYEGEKLLASSSSQKLTLNPLPGSKKYFIKLNDITDNIAVELTYTPDSVFKNIGNSLSGGCELTNVSIPVVQGPLYGIDDWAWHPEKYEDEENEGLRYIKDSMNITQADPAMMRVVKIAQFVLQRTNGMDGTPVDSATRISPIKQLKCAQAGKSKIWCGIYTNIFSYFACKAGVPARIIQCGNSRLNISSGVHVFNEVYIEEYGQWLYVDLLAKTVFVKKGEQYLNVADIHRLLKYNINDSDLVAGYFNGDSIVKKPFNQVASTARYYFNPNNTFSFYFGDCLNIQGPKNLFERGKKAFYTEPYYALYGDNIVSGKSQFIFRIVTTYALLLMLGLCSLFGFLHFKRKRS
jgi:hypothetical protein